MNLPLLAFKNLWHRKMRTSLTILGVGTSIAVFVSLVGLSGIFTDAFQKMYKERETDLIVREKGNVDFLSSGIDEKYAEEIKRIPEVVNVNKVLVDFSQASLRDYFLVLGWDVDSLLFKKLKITGRAPEKEDEAIVGLTIARKLNKKAGDVIEIKGRRLKISGTFESNNMFEDGSVIILLNKLQEIKKFSGKVTLLNIVVKKGRDFDVKAKKESDEINRVRSLISSMVPDVEVRSVEDIISADNTVVSFLGFAWAVSIVAFIAGILGIINTMITSVLEQTSKIGILLAIGWRKKSVLALVLYEAALIGLCGGVFGLILGYVIMHGLVSFPQLENIGRIQYEPVFMLKVITVSLLVGFLSGIYPAIRAISIKPIEALRYE